MGKLVNTEELQPGMVVDKDVANVQGAVLLRKGSELTERHIGIFKTWGISSVFIAEAISAEDLGGRSPQEVADEEIKTFQEHIEEKFADVAGDELMAQIKTIAFSHKIAKIKEKYNVS